MAKTSTNPSGIQLGDRVEDRISGLSGIVTGFYQFLYGCERVSVTPQEHKDGKPAESFTVDAAQCEVIEPQAVKGYVAPVPEAIRPAGPRPDPSPRRDPVR